MAATCQERGITHIKDVFKPNKNKQNNLQDKDDNVQGYFFGLDSPGSNKNVYPASGNKSNSNNLKPGAFIMRSGRDVDVMEIPVPPPRRKRSESNENSPVKDTYITPKAVTRGQIDTTNSKVPAKNLAPLPPAIASPPPPPPLWSRSPPPPPFNPPPPPPMAAAPSPPPPMTAAPPPPPPMTAVPTTPPPPPPLTSPVSVSSPLYSPTPPSPSYVRTITAEVHQPSHRMSDSFNTKIVPEQSRTTVNNQDEEFLFSADVDDDGDILNNIDTRMFSNDSLPSSNDSPQASNDSGIHIIEAKNKWNSASPGPTSPLFKKNNRDKKEQRNRFISPNRNNKRNSTDTETDSSLLTGGSEHGASSSGYFSELSTSDSERLPSPPPAFKFPPTSTNNGSSSSFEEDECTLDFGEDDTFEGKHKKVYHEYQGEDFAQYLQDDDYTTSSTTLTRRVQKHKQRQHAPHNAVSPNRKNTLQGQKKPGLKDRITQAFTLTRSEKRNYGDRNMGQQAPPKNKIHNFTFMNSKMGMYASEEELHDYVTRDLETKSDIGGVRKSAAPVPSWHQDTLSVSTLRRAKVMLDKRTMSSSVPNLTEAEQYRNIPNSAPNSPKGHNNHYGESFSDFAGDVSSKKQVNRFKFWKIFGNKKNKKNREVTSPNMRIQPQTVDVRL